MKNKPFQMLVRRCKRCGGILTSESSIREGYGHSCKIKEQQERAEQAMQKMQISLFEEAAE